MLDQEQSASTAATPTLDAGQCTVLANELDGVIADACHGVFDGTSLRTLARVRAALIAVANNRSAA